VPLHSRATRVAGSPMTTTPAAQTRSERITVITPGRRRSLLREALPYKDLLYFLMRRDLKVRYAQTILGIGWAVLQPVMTMIVFSIFFGSLAGIGSSGVPYPVFSLVGVVLWTYFANTVAQAASSLVGNASLLTKVYFPRLFIPLAPVASGLLDLAISFGVLLVVMAGFGYYPPFPELLILPVPFLLTVTCAAGIGIWFAALAVQFRDVRYTTPFVLQLWLFLTPVIYPLSEIPERVRWVYALNPMAGATDAFRVALLDTGALQFGTVAVSSLSATLILVSGFLYFRHTERLFADVA
jgi:lipopolysaccharide transport system permease protein